MTKAQLLPPKPKELLSTRRTGASRLPVAMSLRNSGSASATPRQPGISPSSTQMPAATASSAPDAPSVCPVQPFIELHGTPRSPDELPDHVAVGYFSSRTGRELDWEYADMDTGELHAVKMRSVVSVNSSQAYLACCLAGLGLIQAPREGLGPLLADGSLVEVLPEWNAEPLPVSVVFPTGRHLAPRVRIFVDWLAETLGGVPRAD